MTWHYLTENQQSISLPLLRDLRVSVVSRPAMELFRRKSADHAAAVVYGGGFDFGNVFQLG